MPLEKEFGKSMHRFTARKSLVMKFSMLRFDKFNLRGSQELLICQLHEILCDDCVSLLNTIRKQAELGSKKIVNGNPSAGKFELYLNEVLIGDNTVLFKMGDKRVTYITHNNFNILTTSQESFCRLTETHMINMMNKSIFD